MSLSLHDYLNWFSDNWHRLVLASVILILFLIIGRPVAALVIKGLNLLTNKTHNKLDNAIMKAFTRPFTACVFIIGIFTALFIFPLPTSIRPTLTSIERTFIVIFIGWGLINLTESTDLFFHQFKRRFQVRFDQIIVPFISNILKFVILFLIVTMIAFDWGYNITGLVTGLGIGGLAVALAAKDTIGNLFGGFVIITEVPFTIGDWVKTPSVEGTVEDISFRSTRIRTFAQALVTVPNSTLANEPITNWSKMGKRRLTFDVAVSLSTHESQLTKLLSRLRHMLKEDDQVDDETIVVQFNQFTNNGLDLYFYFFTKTTDWLKWLEAREAINLKVLKILEEEGVSLAFPTQTVLYVEPEELQVGDRHPKLEKSEG